MPFLIIRQDITKMHVDAIVNSTNATLQIDGGVSGAIFGAAGAFELQAACAPLAPIETGQAVLTPAFKLPAKYIIHTAGPDFRDGKRGKKLKLRACYLNSLGLAVEHQCSSIAFPLISSGLYCFPKEEALRVAISAIQSFLSNHDLDIYLAVYDREAFTVSKKLLGEVASYIDEHYERERALERGFPLTVAESHLTSLNDVVGNLDEPFSSTLLRLIDAKGKTDVEVYKRANLDRKLFSKIRTSQSYIPSKRTAIALAIALELSPQETHDLLKRAGYTLSHSQVFDVIVEYFIIKGKYDIFEINEVLFGYDQPLLGG